MTETFLQKIFYKYKLKISKEKGMSQQCGGNRLRDVQGRWVFQQQRWATVALKIARFRDDGIVSGMESP